MRDWRKLVREQFGASTLSDREADEVVAELADHLEEVSESLCAEGMSEQDAARHALAQVTDWQGLRRKIYLARKQGGIMEPRVTRFWLPGLVSFALAMALDVAAHAFGSHPLLLSLAPGTPVVMFHLSWILALPLAGAVAAYASRRAGGSLRTSLLSSLFPVVPLAAVFLFASLGFVVSHPIPYRIAGEAIAYGALGWVLAPAAALVAGGWLVEVMRLAADQGGNACVV